MSTSTSTAAHKPIAQGRVEKGIPTGGQFKATSHSESDVKLGSARLEEFTDPHKFKSMAYDSAQYWQRRYNQKDKSNTVDLDDIAQETLLRVITELGKGKDVRNFKQLVSSIAANVTVRATENVFRAEDRVAWRIFEEKRTAMEHRENRSLTPSEIKALEQEVLDEWHDPRHKPSKEFMIARTVDRSLDTPFGEGEGVEATLGGRLVSEVESEDHVDPDSYTAQALAAIQEKGAKNKSRARRLAWNALAESAGTPLAQPGILTMRQVSTHREAIADHDGGVLGACKDWSNGLDSTATEALFAPFGDLDEDDQEKVVDVLERLGDARADQMWTSALAYSNVKYAEAS
ncbi:hypothetical protein [Arthrobacter sp. A2-55]|uniref:hypothetical protein n=1 Tax=Arthrobacter sp. A2-55 TaxID=2897337 RepID=UPI0021CD83AB|nr:hypothetical protein [Arthrobacter sp. A2-55]MCU6479095.1 hypothetical protein [Arthrobacter sp. A2-55]